MEEDKKIKKKPMSCPVCGVTIRPSEMENHFEMEKLQLDKITRPQENNDSNKTTNSHHQSSGPLATETEGSTSKNGEASTNTTEEPSSWTTFQKIKSNRNSRLKVKPPKLCIEYK